MVLNLSNAEFDILAHLMLAALTLQSDEGQEQVAAELVAACRSQDDALALGRELSAMAAMVMDKAREDKSG
jgi:hypothetical protein